MSLKLDSPHKDSTYNTPQRNIDMVIVAAFNCPNCNGGTVLVDQHGRKKCIKCDLGSDSDIDKSHTPNQCAFEGCRQVTLNSAVPACDLHLCANCRMGVGIVADLGDGIVADPGGYYCVACDHRIRA